MSIDEQSLGRCHQVSLEARITYTLRPAVVSARSGEGVPHLLIATDLWTDICAYLPRLHSASLAASLLLARPVGSSGASGLVSTVTVA